MQTIDAGEFSIFGEGSALPRLNVDRLRSKAPNHFRQ
jgi:hypothetical protein